jgi:hypothetical protein
VLIISSTFSFVAYAGLLSFGNVLRGFFASLFSLVLYLIASFSFAYLIVWIRH